MPEKKQKKQGTKQRSPIVVVMGHIDHGKSTLLDYIRKTKITENEKGGITQHMGAYEVETAPNKKITFLDTPGHEAFQAIRSRGAKVADIAVLVVAADDGVKPQTLEALKCIREEEMPFVVAINKIDKPDANIEKTKNDLAENEIFLEGFGGDVPFATISAKTGENINELLDLLWLMAEMEELKGDPEILAEGVVLESHLDPKKGVAATLVIKDGTLKKGLFVATSEALAPVRIMESFLGENISEASFSNPIRLVGWNVMPKVGEIFKAFKTKKEAEAFIISSKLIGKNPDRSENGAREQNRKTIVPVIIKADTAGGVEGVEHELKKLGNEHLEFKILSSGIGIITEKDVQKATAGQQKGTIIGFNVKIDNSAKNLAERDEIMIKNFEIIYKITEWLKTDLSQYLPKIEVEEITGKAKILKLFGEQKGRQIVGGKVLEGEIPADGLFRIIRRENILGDGRIKELQQKKEKSGKVEAGNEFGALLEAKQEVAAGDTLEIYKKVFQTIKI